MKKVFLSVFTFSVVLFTIYSCTKEEKYSCDNEIDCWVKENKDKYAKISRDELVKLDFEKQAPLWRSLAPSEKLRVFQEKLDKVILEEKLSSKEITFINQIKAELKPSIYDENSNFDESIYIKRCIETLNWSFERVGFVFGNIMTEKELKEAMSLIKNSNQLKLKPQKETLSCHCKYTSWSCLYGDQCEGGCAGTSWGCGWFWAENCSGRCFY